MQSLRNNRLNLLKALRDQFLEVADISQLVVRQVSMPLLILDRDGVINQDSDDYIRSLDDWKPIPGSIEAIATLSKAGYQVAIATNQSGLSRGFFGLEELEAIHESSVPAGRRAGWRDRGYFLLPPPA